MKLRNDGCQGTKTFDLSFINYVRIFVIANKENNYEMA